MKTLKIFLLSTAFALVASASTVTFVGDQSLYSPYDLTVDGVPIQGICINYNLEVGPGYVWDATVLSATAFSPAEEILLERAEWLAQQFTTNSDWVGLHDAIWDLFGANLVDPTESYWLEQSELNYDTVDLHNFGVLVPDVPNYTQTFLLQVDPPFANQQTPESSGFIICMVISMVLLALSKLLHINRTKPRKTKEDLRRSSFLFAFQASL